MVPVFVLALPIVDINLAIFTRLLERRPLMLAAKDHVSHRLLGLGLTQRQTLALLYLFSILYGLVALGISQAVPDQALAIGGAGLLSLSLIFCLLIVVRWRKGRARGSDA